MRKPVPPSSTYNAEGALLAITAEGVVGWARHSNAAEPMRVVLTVRGTPIASGIADRSATGLVTSGVRTGVRAFALRLPVPPGLPYPIELELRDARGTILGAPFPVQCEEQLHPACDRILVEGSIERPEVEDPLILVRDHRDDDATPNVELLHAAIIDSALESLPHTDPGGSSGPIQLVVRHGEKLISSPPLIENKSVNSEYSDRVAVCIHAFYMDVFEKIAGYLAAAADCADFYVTCGADNHETVISTLARHNLSAKVLVVDNIGMDLFPFLQAVKAFFLNKYLAVVKLHTKNNTTPLGALLGRLMLRRNFGALSTIQGLRDAFQAREELILAGPHDTYKHVHYMMYNNRETYRELCAIVGVPCRTDIGFFAGTMFWMRGALLTPLVEAFEPIAERILADSARAAKTKTGGDGTIAHALERIWAALLPVPDPEVGLIYQKDIEDLSDEVRIKRQSIILGEPFRRTGISDSIQPFRNYAADVRSLTKNPLFEPEYYASQLDDAPNPGIDPALHFVLYGAALGKNPSPGFNTNFYKLNRPDVVRHGVNVLTHYTNSGRKEGVKASPSPHDWLDVAVRHHLFDDSFYRQKYCLGRDPHIDPLAHYLTVGAFLEYSTSECFDPKQIPALTSHSSWKNDKLAEFLENHFHVEYRLHQELIRATENNDFSLLSELTSHLSTVYGDTTAVDICRALYCIHQQNWSEANEILERHWRRFLEGKLNSRHVANITSRIRQINRWDEVLSSVRRDTSDFRICIYTALFGDIDVIPPILSDNGQIDFICFTDTPRRTSGWTYRVIDPGFDDPNMNAKIFKVLPHKYLAEYDYSLFIDANTLLRGRIGHLIVDYLVGNPFVMWSHPERNDVYTEVVAIVEAARHEPTALIRQIIAYHAAGLPKHAGMYEASFIWRAHRDASVVSLMEEWWAHIVRYSKRDQLSLAFLTWQTGTRPSVLSPELGTSRENEYFIKLPHSKLPHDVAVVGASDISLPRSKRRDIWVLYGSKFTVGGATMLRGQQMSRLLAEALDGERVVHYSSFDKIHDSLVILSKGYLTQHGQAAVRGVKKRHNVVLLDPVDMKLSDTVVAEVDGLIASSILAYQSYRSRWPDKPSYHVTHHVDLRLDGVRNEINEARIGYFGELLNTYIAKDIENHVDFVSVDTSRFTTDWIQQLKYYNCHYAMRKRRAIDGHKPFLKGFVAAQYRANIVIQKDAGDASYYLGSDYPYLLPSEPTEDDILATLERVTEGYGSDEWRYGLEVMEEIRRRSSAEHVRQELEAVVKNFLSV